MMISLYLLNTIIKIYILKKREIINIKNKRKYVLKRIESLKYLINFIIHNIFLEYTKNKNTSK